MYYRRQLPVMSAVYRPLKTRRFVMMTMGGYWPVIDRLSNGHLGVVTRDGDFHIGERGRLVFVNSPDGGESWSHATVISGEGSDNRNPAFGVTAKGTLLAAFIKQVNYTDGNYDSSPHTRPTPLHISRSEDNGISWSTSLANVDGRESWPVVSPFGRIVTLEGGTVVMPVHDAETSYVIRSHDDGHTWVDPVAIADGYNETSISDLGDGRMLAVLRDYDLAVTSQSDSEDGGYTWSKPRRLTGPAEHPADVIKLKDGRVLMTYSRRVTPWGILGMISNDDGKTWDENNRILLTADSGIDQGYPSTLQREDGAIVTVYYSSELHLSKGTRPEVLGLHGAAVIYNPEDL